MTLRLTKPGAARPRAAFNPDRPPIWAEGRQRPAFNLMAVLRAAPRRSRALADSLLARLEARSGAAQMLAPVLAQARRALAGDGGPDASQMTALLAPAFRPAAPPAAAPPTPARKLRGDDDLAALRAALHADAPLAARQTVAKTAALPPAGAGKPAALLGRIVAGSAALSLLPVGFGLALLAQLAGEDLRQSA